MAAAPSCATTAPAATGTTGTFDEVGTMLMPSIVGAVAAPGIRDAPGADP